MVDANMKAPVSRRVRIASTVSFVCRPRALRHAGYLDAKRLTSSCHLSPNTRIITC